MRKRYLKTIILMAAAFTFGILSCKEGARFEIGSESDSTPASPEVTQWQSLTGGVRLFFKPSHDKNLLSTNVEYVAPNGKVRTFSISSYSDSIDLRGMPNKTTCDLNVYALSKSGNKSPVVKYTVTSGVSMMMYVDSTLNAKPGFNAFLVQWSNMWEEDMNVHINFGFKRNGVYKEYTTIVTSPKLDENIYIKDLNLDGNESVDVRAHVEDQYGNATPEKNFGKITPMYDELIPKDAWRIPATNDSIAGEPQCFGSYDGSRVSAVIDGIIDDKGQQSLYLNTGGRKGRTGNDNDGNVPWNIMIDLGAEYELSRIVTHQVHGTDNALSKGQYYSGGGYGMGRNVGRYKVYLLNSSTDRWEAMGEERRIVPPTGLSDLEIVIHAQEGDETYCYPDDPKFSKPTRWFRYEALGGFGYGYTSETSYINEITLYGKKKK